MADDGPEVQDLFEDLPIAKWLNQNGNDGDPEEDEMMSMASDLNQLGTFNLNTCSTSRAISVVSTTTEISESDSYDHIRLEIEKLSLSLHFWAMKRIKTCFSKWHEHTATKLNVLHIKYKNHAHIRNKKRMFRCFKKWQILYRNYKSAVVSLSYWVFNVQSSAFSEWKSMYILRFSVGHCLPLYVVLRVYV